jgi:2-keto-4-pentenoate hydratase/2-oxohepta-3-ene-1,7-dioic acid hydratase in catechol pathway
MRLVTYQPINTQELKAGILIAKDQVIDIVEEARLRSTERGSLTKVSTMLDIIAGGEATMALLREIEAKPATDPIPLNKALLKAPIPRPTKNVFCVGWNYLEHFTEGGTKLNDGRELPKYPVFFSKATTAVNGPYDVIPFNDAISTQLDWEVELGVIIGKPGKNISEADAMNHIFGYTVINDVTWRDVQRRHGGQWHKGKSLDGTCPMGPCIVTADALNPMALNVECRVSGVVKQRSNTRHLYFKIPRLIHDLSEGMTLEAGDIISTGTPEGVGFARTPPEWLKPGDLLETEIEGIGIMRNPVGSY